jgi:hypothetical protein
MLRKKGKESEEAKSNQGNNKTFKCPVHIMGFFCFLSSPFFGLCPCSGKDRVDELLSTKNEQNKA